MEMTNKNVCPKCGQIYDIELAKCPLCGAAAMHAPTEERPVGTGRCRREPSAEEKKALRQEEEAFLREEEGRYRRMKHRGQAAEPDDDSDTNIPKGFIIASVLVLVLALFIGGSFLLWKANVVPIGLYDRLAGKAPAVSTTEAPQTTQAVPVITTEPSESSAEETTQATTEPEETQPKITLPFTFDINDPILALVNESNPIASDYPVSDLATLGTGAEVNRLCMDDLQEMVSACRNAAHYPGVYSGYDRTASDTSEYRTGLAVDIFPETDQARDVSTQIESETLIWLWEHCWEYGFIVRYPEGKESITGHDYEPWHFRYVGQDVAQYMHDNDLCFEEMAELLKQAG